MQRGNGFLGYAWRIIQIQEKLQTTGLSLSTLSDCWLTQGQTKRSAITCKCRGILRAL